MFLKIYLIGILLAILTYVYIYLKTKECCQKANFSKVNKAIGSAANTFKVILFTFVPLFGYILFFGMLSTENEEIEQIINKEINKYQ